MPLTSNSQTTTTIESRPPVRLLVSRFQLLRALEMFFGKLGHSEVLQPEADHPMVKRIVGRELVGLLFVSARFLDSA